MANTAAQEHTSSERPNIFTQARDDVALSRVLANIEALDLSANLIELQTRGFTTLKAVLSEARIRQAKQAILERIERDTGKCIDLDHATAQDFEGMTYVPYMLYDNEVFEDILMEPRPLALITYLLGESCVLSSIGSHFKGPGDSGQVPLHSDNGNGIPSPFPNYSMVANVNYALTPYSREAGALAVVPGSHLRARQTTAAEMNLAGDNPNPEAIAMDLSPGDAVVWHGNTWHGSFPRQIPGIRMNLAVYFARQFVVTQEHHKGAVPEDVLARHANDERFQTLVAGKQPYGWQHEGPDYAMMARAPRGLFD
jgi:ectoine hydroxylase-related dioxygenase (phytanoyl-CoA dioxygenase family)